MLVKEIAEIHKKQVSFINRNIKNNIQRFKCGVDFIDLKTNAYDACDFKKIFSKAEWGNANNIYLLSERGYSKLLKIMEDDTAWKLYDKFVDGYFQMRKIIKQPTQLEIMKMAISEIEIANGRLDVIENKLDNEMGLSGSQEYQISKLVNKKVYFEAKKIFELEELTDNAKKSIRPMFQELNRLIKIKFGISHRNDIPRSRYDQAVGFINSWYPSIETELKVINKFEELVK